MECITYDQAMTKNIVCSVVNAKSLNDEIEANLSFKSMMTSKHMQKYLSENDFYGSLESFRSLNI